MNENNNNDIISTQNERKDTENKLKGTLANYYYLKVFSDYVLWVLLHWVHIINVI